MANEISVGVRITAVNAGANVRLEVAKLIDMAGRRMSSTSQTLSTSEEELDVGDCATLAVLGVENQDAEIAVTLSLDEEGAQVLGVLPPGGVFVTQGLTSPPFAKSASGTPNIWVVAVEN